MSCHRLVHGSSMPVPEPRIIGREALVNKRSAVDAEARWRTGPIDGLAFGPVGL